MKNTVLVGILCLVIGVAVGWLAKPNDHQPEALAGVSPDHSSSRGAESVKPSPGTRGEIPSKSPDRAAKADKPDDERVITRVIGGADAEAMQDRWHQRMLDQLKQKTDRKVAELVKKLGLDDEQAARLQAYFDGKLDGLENGGGDKGFTGMQEFGKLLRNDSIDEALADIMTDDQAVAYEEMKTNERNRKVESRALKDLAKINTVLDLSDDQKEAVYDILYDDAGKKVDSSANSSSMMSVIMDGHGLDIDLEDLGLGGLEEAAQAQTELADQDGNPGGEVDWKQVMEERNQRRIDQQVERLAPALSDDQAAQYREHLESKNQGFLGGAFMGDGTGGIESHVEVIEIQAGEDE